MAARNPKRLFLKKTEDNINFWLLKSEIYERCSPEEKEMYKVDYKTTPNLLCPFVKECSLYDVSAFYYSVNVYPFTEGYSHIFSSLESAMKYVIKINKKYPRD